MEKKAGLIYRAIPDSGKTSVVPTDNGNVQAIWPNCTVIPPDIFRELQSRAKTFWFPPKNKASYAHIDWVVNMCADADEYGGALRALDEAFAGSRVPIFNHPRAIATTRRDVISQRLKGIPGLIAPDCVRFLADGPERFEMTFRENSFEYPVLVRPTSSQTGQGLVKIDHAGDWRKVHTIPWGGRHLYMTQFVDFVGADSTYTKFRMALVGGESFFRSVFFRESWLVHGASRTPHSVAREIEFSEELARNEKLSAILDEVSRRTPVDYGGIDLGLDRNGNFVLFEANAAMSISGITIRRTRFYRS